MQKQIDEAKLVGHVSKLGSNLIWFQWTAILTSTEIIFYKKNEQFDKQFDSAILIKDAIVKNVSAEQKRPHSIEITSRYGNAVISFATEEQAAEWEKKINYLVYQIKLNEDWDIQDQEIAK